MKLKFILPLITILAISMSCKKEDVTPEDEEEQTEISPYKVTVKHADLNYEFADPDIEFEDQSYGWKVTIKSKETTTTTNGSGQEVTYSNEYIKLYIRKDALTLNENIDTAPYDDDYLALIQHRKNNVYYNYYNSTGPACAPEDYMDCAMTIQQLDPEAEHGEVQFSVDGNFALQNVLSTMDNGKITVHAKY